MLIPNVYIDSLFWISSLVDQKFKLRSFRATGKGEYGHYETFVSVHVKAFQYDICDFACSPDIGPVQVLEVQRLCPF